MRWRTLALIGGGLVTVGGVTYAVIRSKKTADAIKDAVDAPAVDLPPSPAAIAKMETFDVRLTGYWPYQAGLSTDERKMEGGTNDRKGKPIITLEMHQRDPVRYPYVSVAGDYSIFPYGQRLIISAWPNLVFRVVDTGGHFFGAGKLYRVVGNEPLDIAVDSSKTVVPKKDVTAKIVPGDNFEKGRAVATVGLKDQTVRLTGEGDVREARTADDYEALARAVESELGSRPEEEQLAAAWAMRNRADDLDVSLKDLLAPSGYGPPEKSGGYVSTRRLSTDKSRKVAAVVLEADASQDPTQGAVEFWVPSHQSILRQCGDVYRVAKHAGDGDVARRFEHYADYDTEGDVRVKHARDGLRVVTVVGAVELLGRNL